MDGAADVGVPIVFAEARRNADAYNWRVDWQRPGDGSNGRAKLTVVIEVERGRDGVDPATFDRALVESRVAADALRELDARLPVT